MDLQHAKRYSLTQLNLAEQLTLAVTLTPPQPTDISLFGLSSRRKLRDDGYMVFYNQKASPNNEISMHDGKHQEAQRFEINLPSLPAHVARLLVVITPEDAALSAGETIIDLLDQHGDTQGSYQLTEEHLANQRAIFVCELVRTGGQWYFCTNCTPFDGDLRLILEHFGGVVEDDGADTADLEFLPPISSLPPQQAAPPKVETRIAVPLPGTNEQEQEYTTKLLDLIARIPKMLERLQTEEATKHALVMPFLQALGYDIFDPTEVVPEFISDVGIKRGEKVDYAILENGRPVILLECKHHAVTPTLENASQLYRYFSVTDARFAILTNGVIYRFYTDLDKPNMMDHKPFLEVNLLSLTEDELVEILKFAKHSFNQDDILGSASEMKYVAAIKQHLVQEFTEPTDEFIKLLIARVYDGRLTTNVRNRFATYTRKALNDFISQLISERLRSAFDASTSTTTQISEPEDQDKDDDGLNVTPEEWQAFYIIKSVLRNEVNYARIYIRKHQSYCAVLLDNNRRKTICRLYFTEKRLAVGLFDAADRHEQRVIIDTLDDFFKYADRLKKSLQHVR